MADRNRVTQVGVEVLTEVVSKTRVTQIAVEVLTSAVANPVPGTQPIVIIST